MDYNNYHRNTLFLVLWGNVFIGMMRGPQVLVFFCLLATSNSINRPVVKIVLTQKGFAQFLQYDVEIPPMREFTLCAWVRVSDLAWDQTIFTYVGSGSSRIIRLWLAAGGQRLRVSIDGRAYSSAAVEFVPDAWRHVCLSYQSDYGAWALYIDSRLVYCKASQKLLGFIVPGGGSLILGYGTSEKGVPNGLEGEIFGASMILYSTIERNHTLKIDPRYEQKPFRRNQINVKNKYDHSYIVLGDLKTEEIRSNLQKTPQIANRINKTRNFIHFTTPHSHIDHDVGFEFISENPKLSSLSNEEESLDIAVHDDFKSNENGSGGVSFSSLFNKNEKRKVKNETNMELIRSGTRDFATIFEHETPPPVTAPKTDYSNKELSSQANIGKLNNNYNKMLIGQTIDAISELEKPPPPEEKPQVYGQWTNSKFAGNVLKYLNSINFNKNREPKKVPSTIPLVTLFDSFPYASEYKHTKIRSPLEFNRKQYSRKRHVLKKRDLNQPQINLKIIESDLRSEILKSHSETQPKLVEITNRGEPTHNEEQRHYRHAENYTASLESVESIQFSPNLIKGQPFSVTNSQNNQKILSNLERHRGSNLMTILPFLKSVEYFVYDENNKTKNNLIYSKTSANVNKRHNVKSYSKPRNIDLEAGGKSNLDDKIAENRNRQSRIRFKYTYDDHKLVNFKKDVSIEKGRALAEEVSNQANENNNDVSLLKYNHGFLPGHENKRKSSNKMNTFSTDSSGMTRKGNFNKNVKLGNALNEKHVLGIDKEQTQQSFIGGNDEIPDIYKYRSEWDNTNENIPPSLLQPKVCKNIELYDRVMYVQPDGSIDLTHIFSPVREKNLGIEFIIQNYKLCSMQDSTLEKSRYLLIDWSKTPVKLFGGAYPKHTKDLCGFF